MRRLMKPFAILMMIVLMLPALSALAETSAPAPARAPIEAPAQDQIVRPNDKTAAGAPVNQVIDHGVGTTSAPTRMALS